MKNSMSLKKIVTAFMMIYSMTAVSAETMNMFDHIPVYQVAPATVTSGTMSQMYEQQTQFQVKINPEIFNLKVGDRVNIDLDVGLKVLVIDSLVKDSKKITLYGHLDRSQDKVMIVKTEKGLFGRIMVGDDIYTVISNASTEVMNKTNSYSQMPPDLEDMMVPSPMMQNMMFDMRPPYLMENTSSVVTDIDIMVVYNDELYQKEGQNLLTKIEYLVSLANQYYKNSGVLINLRLVATQKVSYPSDQPINNALNDLTSNINGFQGFEQKRTDTGADVVVLLRNLTDNNGCGVAWLLGANQYGTLKGYESYAYAVVGVGSNQTGQSCMDSTFAHEIGHLMGAAHDRPNSSVPGVFSYSYGHGVSGRFGTIMSYVSPRTDQFSNPNNYCYDNILCGDYNFMNVQRTFNNIREEMAAFRATVNTTSEQFNLTVSKTGSGTITSSPNGINCGSTCAYTFNKNDVVTLTQVPETGYVFKGWTGACTGTESCNVTMNQVQTVQATFELVGPPPSQYSLNISKVGSGTVTSSPSGINCGTSCTYNFKTNQLVRLTAKAATGYEFKGWTGACTGTGTCNVTMTKAQNVQATFSLPVMQTLTVSKTGSGTITSNPSGINCGSTCTYTFKDKQVVELKHSATSGYEFKGWTGACTGTVACRVTMNQAQNVQAKFDVKSNMQTVNIKIIGSGTVTSTPRGINCPSVCTYQFPLSTTVYLSTVPNYGYVKSSQSVQQLGNTYNVTVEFRKK